MSEAGNDHVALSIEDGIARITLDRAARHNAFDEVVIENLTAILESIAANGDVRVVILAAAGRNFCAGADLEYMRRGAEFTEEENIADAGRLAHLLSCLDHLEAPTIVLVQGAAYGGGVGLVAACDIAIASEAARFCLSEVRLGLIPAVISPYVIAAIGARAARRWFLTAEPFDAAEAFRIGLVHQVVPAGALEHAGATLARTICANAPGALAAAKHLIADVAARPADQALIDDTARRIAAIRAGNEAREGMAAFLEKRPARWGRRDDPK